MPYDTHGRWIPPDDNWRTSKFIKKDPNRKGWIEATEAEGGRQWSWDEIFNLDTGYDSRGMGDDFKGLIGSGLLSEVFPNQYDSDGNVDVDKTLHMFNTSQYNQMDGGMRYEILRRYQDYYYGEDNIQWAPDGEVNVLKDGKWEKTTTIEGFSKDLREDLNWGLDVQREWYGEKTDNLKDWKKKGSDKIFQELMGLKSDASVLNKYFEYGSKSDFRYYNSNAQPLLNSMRQYVFGDNYQQDYTTVEEVRKARKTFQSLTTEEREKASSWAAKFIMPYKDHEQTASDSTPWEFHRSMKFDTETNTMNYYDEFVGHAKIDLDGNPITHTIEPPAEPTEMDIRVGDTVQPLHDSDGNRIANESSVNELYQRYLGRGMNDEEKGNLSTLTNYPYDSMVSLIQNSPEAQANKANWLDPNDKIYFNPQEYGSPESITARMRKEPAKIKAPTITIRNIGQPKKPFQPYMKLPSHWLTEAPLKVSAATKGDKT